MRSVEVQARFGWRAQEDRAPPERVARPRPPSLSEENEIFEDSRPELDNILNSKQRCLSSDPRNPEDHCSRQ